MPIIHQTEEERGGGGVTQGVFVALGYHMMSLNSFGLLPYNIWQAGVINIHTQLDITIYTIYIGRRGDKCIQ